MIVARYGNSQKLRHKKDRFSDSNPIVTCVNYKYMNRDAMKGENYYFNAYEHPDASGASSQEYCSYVPYTFNFILPLCILILLKILSTLSMIFEMYSLQVMLIFTEEIVMTTI